MANIQSAEKQNRQRIRREARNRARKAEMRTAVKKLRAAIDSKDAGKAKEALKPALRLLDRAGRKGTIKRGTANRTVSRLVKAVNGLSAPASK